MSPPSEPSADLADRSVRSARPLRSARRRRSRGHLDRVSRGHLDRVLRALAVVGVLALAATPAGATVYHVDGVNGIDDVARDGSMFLPYRTIGFALQVASSPMNAPHEVLVLPGTYTSPVETFPLRVPPSVTLRGTDPATTRIVDRAGARRPTIQWRVRPGDLVLGTPGVANLTIERALQGPAVQLLADDRSAQPVLSNLTITGGEFGVEMLATSESAAAGLSTIVERCTILGSGVGILATAYTVEGAPARIDPQIRNTVVAESSSDGVVFETAASWSLSVGQRGAAQSAPILTHATIANNVGSGIYLDNSNLYVRYRAGSITPTVTNSILSGNGDYALHEYTSSSDPAVFDRNLIGGNGLAFYRDEGTTDLLLLASVPGSGNIDALPRFVRGLGPDYHLRADSPGVDDALPNRAADDIDGQMRPRDSDRDGTAAPEIGADEVPGCAVDAVIDPAVPPERCGTLGGMVDLSAAGSSLVAGFSCPEPLEFVWYANGAEAGTGPRLTHLPEETTIYAVVARCPSAPDCRDTATATVVVHALPVADAKAGADPATGVYSACVAHDAPDVPVALLGRATPLDPGASIRSTSWTSPVGVFTGGASTNPILSVPNTGQNQSFEVTLTVRDSFDCEATSSAQVQVWRGPDVSAGGPYVSCMTAGATTTAIPLSAIVDVPAGSSAASWRWTSTLGTLTNADRPDASLSILNVPITRMAVVTVRVTDDHGCQDEASTQVTLFPSPIANAGGPYQQQETGSGTASFALNGTSTGPPAATRTWTTTLGTFQSTGTQAATGPDQVLDVVETGADQSGMACYEVVATNGCVHVACATVSLRNSPPLPPADVGATFRVEKTPAGANLTWANSPVIAGEADIATSYQVWQSTTPRPVAGTWSVRIDGVPWTSGTSGTVDAALLDIAGPDLVFLKVVSVNVAGASCADPVTMLPDCPDVP